MARPLRLEYPGAYYHVINRGNAGENIFLTDQDKEKFLEYLATATERFSIVIHTYCLMDNHCQRKSACSLALGNLEYHSPSGVQHKR